MGQTNKDFQVVKHRGGKAVITNLLAVENQAKKGTDIINGKHSLTPYSIYTIISDDNDNDNKEGVSKEAIIYSDVDAKMGDIHTQTNKAKNKRVPNQEKSKHM